MHLTTVEDSSSFGGRFAATGLGIELMGGPRGRVVGVGRQDPKLFPLRATPGCVFPSRAIYLIDLNRMNNNLKLEALDSEYAHNKVKHRNSDSVLEL